MEHRENGAPDAQSNEQKVIKIDAASTAASATSGQYDETKAVSDSALPKYGSDMDAGRPAKRPGLLGKLRDSLISGWYTPGERMSQDRACLVISNYTTNIVANLIGGSFYTGLLLLMDADDSFIGTMSMIGVAANMAQMFAPLLLERFTQRKKLLMTVRAITMVINILVVGLIPLAPVPHQAQLTMLGICVAVVNFAGSLISPGLSIWHIQSVPPRVRTSYFSLVTMTVGPIVAICNLGGSAIVDMFKARGNEYGGLMALRIIALALYVVDFCMYAHIKEYPYENAGSKFTLRDLFTLPFKNKLYLRSIAVVFLWNVTYNIPGSYYIVYLLKKHEPVVHVYNRREPYKRAGRAAAYARVGQVHEGQVALPCAVDRHAAVRRVLYRACVCDGKFAHTVPDNARMGICYGNRHKPALCQHTIYQYAQGASDGFHGLLLRRGQFCGADRRYDRQILCRRDRKCHYRIYGLPYGQQAVPAAADGRAYRRRGVPGAPHRAHNAV